VLAVLVGAINLIALPLLVAAVVVYASFASCLGLWFSTVSGSTMRAGLFTLLAALLFLAVPGALTVPRRPPVDLPSQAVYGTLGSLLLQSGLSPPTTLWVLTFRAADLVNRNHYLGSTLRILAAVAGPHCYLAATALLWVLTRWRLRKR